jgi:hypothetical protein
MGAGKGKSRRVLSGPTPRVEEKEWSGELPPKGVYLDDRREPPSFLGWDWVKTTDELKNAVETAQKAGESIAFISLDFNLDAADKQTGEDVLDWLVADATRWPRQLLLHTGDFEARKRMQATIVALAPYTVVEETPLGPLYS